MLEAVTRLFVKSLLLLLLLLLIVFSNLYCCANAKGIQTIVLEIFIVFIIPIFVNCSLISNRFQPFKYENVQLLKSY